MSINRPVISLETSRKGSGQRVANIVSRSASERESYTSRGYILIRLQRAKGKSEDPKLHAWCTHQDIYGCTQQSRFVCNFG